MNTVGQMVPIPPIPVDYIEYENKIKNIPLQLTPQRPTLSSAEYVKYMRSQQIPIRFTPCLTAYMWNPYGVDIREEDVDRAKQWYKRTIEPVYKIPQQLMTFIEMIRKQQLSRKKRRRIQRNSRPQLGQQQEERITQPQEERGREQQQQERITEQQQREQQEEEERITEQQQQEQEQQQQADMPLLWCEEDQLFLFSLQECQQQYNPQEYMYSPPQDNNQLLIMPQEGQYELQMDHNSHHGNAPQPIAHSQPQNSMFTSQHDVYQYNLQLFMYHQQQIHPMRHWYPYTYQQ
ncbi:uncharacterized protein TM35_000181670 [Trypanosoma theileri]|uniref:Uncharacterized protein n=1 Tax=Trypanosoma theileri TaxID=67003 RepID=A0A1X0NVH0_9TRYP|nr:uncharacterized protein TM35_000181670 [Trypanosoma theileri]ORC88110.1 hypothetical protein TM35_000181670 [Trypanosoma theileri]